MDNSVEQFEAHVKKLFLKPQDDLGRLLHAGAGASSEAGEILTQIKGHWIYGKELDSENLLEEAGDCLFYLVAMLQNQGFTLEQAFEHNIAKLKKRYPDGYSDQAAIDRADKQ